MPCYHSEILCKTLGSSFFYSEHIQNAINNFTVISSASESL